MAFKKYSKLCFISYFLFLSTINPVNSKRSHIATKATANASDDSANNGI